MVIDTRNWWPGKKVLVATDWIDEINWVERLAYVNMTRDNIKDIPEFEPGMPVKRAYEQRLYDFYAVLLTG